MHGQVTWDGSAADGLWATGSNWDTGTPPGSGDDAVFDADNAAGSFNVILGANRPINSITFAAATSANAFTIGTNNLIIGSGGLTNADDQTQSFNIVRTGAAQTWDLTGDVSITTNLNIVHDLTINGTGNVDLLDRFSINGNLTFTVNSDGGVTTNNIRLRNTLTLAGTGDVDVSGALVNFGGNFTFLNDSDGAVTINNVELSNTATNQTLTMGGATDTVVSGIVSNGSSTASNLTKTGTNTLRLEGDNTYTGTTNIDAGTLVVAGQMASGNIAIGSGATLNLEVASGVRDNATSTNFTGTGTLAKTGSGEIFWNSAVADFALGSGALIDVREGTFRGANGGNDIWTNNLSDLNVEAGATFNGAGLQIRVDELTGAGRILHGFTGPNRLTFGVDNGSATFEGTLEDFVSSGGTGDFAKVGTGNQTLSGNNTFSGTMAVEGGTLTLASDTALGTTAAGTSVDGGATLALTGNITVAETITNNGTVTNTSGTNTLTGDISGAGTVTTSGGQLTLTGSNTYTGDTTINAGSTLIAASNSALGASSNDTTVNSGGTLGLDGGVTLAQGNVLLAGTGNGGAGAMQNIAGANQLTADFELTANATLQSDAGTLSLGTSPGYNNYASQLFDNAGFDLTVDGAGDTNLYAGYSGTGDLIKAGSGTLLVEGTVNPSSATVFSGETFVHDGELILANLYNDAPGVGPLDDFFINNNITVGDGIGAAGSATLTMGTNDAGGIIDFDNMIGANVNLTVNADGTFDTRGHTQYVQDITLDGGFINAQTAAATGNNLFVTGDIFSTHTSQTATIDGLLDFNADAAKTLNVAAGSTLDIDARIQNGGFDKTGDGLLILSGSNTFTGQADISAGIVRVDNNQGLGATAGSTTVDAGAQLQLDGVAIANEALTLNGSGISADGALRPSPAPTAGRARSPSPPA